MTDLPTIAVTGSTGFVGGEVARQLAISGVAQRLLVRDAATAPKLDRTIPFSVSYSDRDAAITALDGVDTLFMVSGRESADRVDDHFTFIDAAAEAGVKHLIYTSFTGAAPDAVFTLARDHHRTEHHIEKSGMGFTFLRNTLYADFLPLLAGPDGVIRGPAGDGRVAGVCRVDVARVAFHVIREPSQHRDETYELTGPEAISLAEAAAIISAATDQAVSYVPETVEEAYASRATFEAPDWQVDAWVSTYTAIAAGVMAEVTDDVERVTGTRAITLAEYLNSHH